MRRGNQDSHVLLVDPIGERRLELATSWRVSGRRVTEAATPLEAIRFLGDAGRPHYMAIAETSPRSIGEELRAYVIAEHDDVDVSRVRAGGTHE